MNLTSEELSSTLTARASSLGIGAAMVDENEKASAFNTHKSLTGL